jgi:hypothetical protein
MAQSICVEIQTFEAGTVAQQLSSRVDTAAAQWQLGKHAFRAAAAAAAAAALCIFHSGYALLLHWPDQKVLYTLAMLSACVFSSRFRTSAAFKDLTHLSRIGLAEDSLFVLEIPQELQ